MADLLVTGGAGYKGIKLTSRLLEMGHDVTVLDNFMYGYEPILHLAEKKNLTVVKQDIRNTTAKDVEKFDVVFHLAGISGFPACAANPHSAQLINVDATKALVGNLRKDQHFIFASTTSLYGKSGAPCNEDMPVDPVSTYAMTKLAAERKVLEHGSAVSLRFATVFGFSPRMRMDLMVNDFVYRALKERVVVLFDSFAKRTFIHIDDAVDAYIFAMENIERMKGSIYNAGGNNLNYSKRDIADFVKKRIDFEIVESELADKDLRHFIVNYNKIEGLGFVPKKTVEDGIDELLRIFSFYEYFSHFRPI